MFRNVWLPALGLYFVISGQLGCASTSSPLHLGQEILTGGRAAQSQWETYDALSQMYQSQVFLNLVRLIEYGQAPLHFEFDKISAIITDTATVSSGFEFFDSPLGINVVGTEVLGNGEMQVKFTPNVGTDRKVQIQADAKPVLRKDWIYDWYYTVADRMQDKSVRIFAEYQGAEALARDLQEKAAGRPALWYRGKLYALHKGQAYDAELGALTAIVSYLRESRPSEVFSTEVVFEGEEIKRGSNEVTLRISNQYSEKFNTDLAKKLNALPSERKPTVRLLVPQKQGAAVPFSLRLIRVEGNYSWRFRLTPVALGSSDINSNKPEVRRAMFIANLNALKAMEDKNPIKILISVERPAEYLSLSEAAAQVARRPGTEAKPTETDLLEEIVSSLNQIRVQIDGE